MIFVLLSTPTCAFIPKYHCLPFFVVHLRIALLLPVLGRSGCVQDGRVDDRAGRDSHPLRLQVQGSPAPGSVRPVGVVPASAGTCTPWSRPAPAHSPNQCPRTAASPQSRTAPLLPPGPTG